MLMRNRTLFPSFFIADKTQWAEWALGYDLSAAADYHSSFLL